MVDLADVTDPLRILHLLYLRFWSAIAWHALSMAQALVARGHTCWIAGAGGSPILQRAEESDLAARDLALPWLRPWNWLPSIARLRRFLGTHEIDAIFVHTGSGHFEAHLARRGTDAALLRVRADARIPRATRAQRWLYTRATDGIAASGAYILEDYLRDFKLAPERRHHVPPGIDLAAFEPDGGLVPATARREIRARHRLDPERPLIGIIGRLSPVKGHAALIRALGLLARDGLRPALLIVGAEKQVKVASLMQLASAVGVESQVHFTDWVSDPMRYAAALDVGVIASLGSEAVSRSALEFMALGVPVVATRVGILPEVVASPDQLVAPGEPAELAGAIGRLLADPQRARAAGAAGRARVAHHFSFEQLGGAAEEAARAALVIARGGTTRRARQ